jgi:MFS family permease
VQEDSRAYRGWRIVAACFVIATFAWGFGFYGQGVYLAQLHALKGWSLSLVSGAVTVFYFVSAVMVAFVSDWIRRFGAPRVMAFGLVATGVAVALLGLVDSPWQLYGAFLLMSFGWASTSVGAITNILGLWFSSRRGLAISLALTGASAGGIVVVPALQALVSWVGFERAMLFSGAMLIVCIAPLALFAIETPPIPTPTASGGASSPALTRARMLRSFAFWSVAGPFALAQTTQVAFLVHQISIFTPVIGGGRAALAVSVTTFAAVAGRVLLGLVVDRLDQRLVTALSVASQAAALAAIALSPSPIVLLVAAAVYGVSVGNLITLPSLIIQREFESAAFGLVVALATSVNQMAYSFGPGLLGAARDAAGAYEIPLISLAVINAVTAVAMLTLRPRRSPG